MADLGERPKHHVRAELCRTHAKDCKVFPDGGMIIGFDSHEWWEKEPALKKDRRVVVFVGDNCWYISGYGMSDEEIKLLTDRCSGRAQTEKQK
jgi:hypothetical protein